MDAPPPEPTGRRFSRRTLFRLAGAGAILGLSSEAFRVLIGNNEHVVIPGKVYRSAQLTQEKLKQVIEERHVRTVINLRGCCPDMDWYLGDARATHDTGISQEDLTLSAKRYPPPGEISRLIETFDRTEYPVLLHCARGADRTGLASTVALLLLTTTDLGTARRQLWPRYGHVALGRTAVLDKFLDYYEGWLQEHNEQHTPDHFRAWVAKDYCPGPFRAQLGVVAPLPLVAQAGRGFVVTIRATNKAIEPWTFVPGASGGVRLRYALYTRAGELTHRGQAGFFARTVQPGESIDLAAGFPPLTQPGPHVLHVDMLDSQPIDLLDVHFAQYGSDPLIVDLAVN